MPSPRRVLYPLNTSVTALAYLVAVSLPLTMADPQSYLQSQIARRNRPHWTWPWTHWQGDTDVESTLNTRGDGTCAGPFTMPLYLLRIFLVDIGQLVSRSRVCFYQFV